MSMRVPTAGLSVGSVAPASEAVAAVPSGTSQASAPHTTPPGITSSIACLHHSPAQAIWVLTQVNASPCTCVAACRDGRLTMRLLHEVIDDLHHHAEEH